MTKVRFEMHGAVGHIVLTAPPTNAINRPFVDALGAAVTQAGASPARALLITAEGENFGTGGDIAEWPDKTRQWFTAFIGDANSAYRAIEALRIPTVAAVQGACISGHYELALHCDFIIAAEDATFTWIEAKAAMAPLAGGIQRLSQRIGRSLALRQVMLAETLTAPQAVELGIALRTEPASALHAAADAFAAQLASGPTRGFAAMKALSKAWASGGVGAADALMLDLSMDLFETDDSRNAFRMLSTAVDGILPDLTYSG